MKGRMRAEGELPIKGKLKLMSEEEQDLWRRLAKAERKVLKIRRKLRKFRPRQKFEP